MAEGKSYGKKTTRSQHARRQLKEHDWINERDKKKPGKGRPYKIYSLSGV